MAFGTTSSLPYSTGGNIDEIYRNGFVAEDYADIQSWVRFVDNAGQLKYSQIPLIGTSGFTAAGEGVAATPEAVGEGYKGEVTAVEYKYDLAISDLGRRTMAAGGLTELINECGAEAMRHYYNLACAILNGGDAAAMGQGDTKYLFATDHPIPGGSYSNKLGSSIGANAFAAAVLALELTPDVRGIVGRSMRCTRAIVPSASKVTLQQLLGATHLSNDLSKSNVWVGQGIAPTFLQGITDTADWFVTDDRRTSIVIPVVHQQGVELYQDPKTKQLSILDLIECAHGALNWRGIVKG